MSKSDQKKKKKKKPHRLFWRMVKIQLILMLLVLGAVGYYFYGGYGEQVQALQKEAVRKVLSTTEKTFIPAQTCTIYDCNNNVLTERRTGKSSDYVRYEDIPADIVSAIISIEDKKFFSHSGIDYKAVLRVVKAMLQNGKVTQGGSTITMQLAKLIYLEPSRTWQYKAEQMFLALELEKCYSKNKIMEFYLNNIYFANNYYGIKAACYGYFNCELNELDLSQIAFLCAIPNSPSYYDPVVNMDHTLERRNLILDEMLEDGKITQLQHDSAVAEEIILSRPQEKATELHNYVDTYVYYCATRALMEQAGFTFQQEFDSEEEQKEYYEEYDQLYADCQKQVFSGGYQIYTSIDMDKQKLLQEALDSELADFTEVSEDGAYCMQGSAVCIDNETGFVVAIVGGRDQDFSTYTLNRAYQSHRQPGSAIKPLVVYTPAFETGRYDPDTTVVDQEIEGGPSNSSGSYAGSVSLRYAVAKSLNTVAWQIYEELTPAKGLSYLKKMNFSKIVKEDNTLATCLGGFTKGASALEMAGAYATLENDGIYRTPTCIRAIVDKDETTIYESSLRGEVIYDQTAARMMTDVLTSVMEYGTGKSLRLLSMSCAGKTGTTNSQKDGWFVGYTRYYTTSVWVGYDLPREVEDLTGSSYPGRIWNKYMQQIHVDLPALEFLPYAQLSEEFQQQLQEEQERHEAEREEANQPEDPQETPEEPESPQETPEEPENPQETPEEPENPQETPEEPESPQETQEEPENPQETPENPQEEPENPQETPEEPESPQETPEEPLE